MFVLMQSETPHNRYGCEASWNKRFLVGDDEETDVQAKKTQHSCLLEGFFALTCG